MQVPEAFEPRIPEWTQLKTFQYVNDVKLESSSIFMVLVNGVVIK
jgi:hypothetical protein